MTELGQTVKNICDSLATSGHSTFCSFDKNAFFDENKYSYKQILDYALRELDESDVVLAFVKSPEKSEGMLLELGYAMATGKKIILALKEGAKPVFLPEIASTVIHFSDLPELYSKLKTLNLN